MSYIQRSLTPLITHLLGEKQSILLLGARQTGKTTLIEQFKLDMHINLIEPEVRFLYEAQPARLAAEVKAVAETINGLPIVFIDEIQKVPLLLDTIQSLIDQNIAQFILTGSSARKLKHHHQINLLPGRIIQLQLDPLNMLEAKEIPGKTIEDYLINGALPGILTITDDVVRELKLKTYVSTYLEEEIRQEAAVRQLNSFTRFLQLAAQQSGNLINLQKLSQELGISHTTISRYFQLLEDCLIAEQIPAFHLNNFKRQLVKAPKLIFFDLGVRRVAAQEGQILPQTHQGRLFEQWLGIEIQKLVRNKIYNHKLSYWRDRNGIEVDWILTIDDQHIPIEAKWTTNPNEADTKHLQIFLKDYPETKKAYLVCRIPRAMKLTEKIYALPWQEIPEIISN